MILLRGADRRANLLATTSPWSRRGWIGAPVSGAVYDQVSVTSNLVVPPPHDDERASACPSCHRRLAIPAMCWAHDEAAKPRRGQLWVCPRGHATAYRVRGVFTTIELLEDVS